MTTEFIIKFDYTLEALQGIAKDFEKTDLTDIEKVKEEHRKFVKIRTTIKKQEKEMVDGANEFRTKVFDKRNEYLAITEPIEKKLKDILDMEEHKKVMEARLQSLPSKKQALSSLDISAVTDEFILSLDDTQWVTFFGEKVNESNANIARKEQDKKREEERVQREVQIKKEAEERSEREKKQLIEKADQDKKDAIEKLQHEQKEKEDREKARLEREAIEKKEAEEKARIKAEQEKAKLESDKKYQKFLKDNDYNESTDKIIVVGIEQRIYRLVATFTK